MCGICGLVSVDPSEVVDRSLIARMRDTLAHRGPDDIGLYAAPGVGLGHRRLSIIDLRPEGRQPMANEDGSIRIVFNGEIYNFNDYREWLSERGHRFKSYTDTEVIVHLYEEMGVECVRHLRGMFAFAIWDEPKRLLFLARDRLGKKPLFYYCDGRHFLFGSEPKAILAHPDVEARPDLSAIDNYLALGYVPSPQSAFAGIRKLAPAHYLTFSDGTIRTARYWKLRYEPKLQIDAEDARREILERLREAVKLRMISDVPLGAFLSGGIDSSAVVAIMSEFSSQPVKTFSIGFKERDYDETSYARLVSKRFGTDHHEFVVDPVPFDVLHKLVWHYNEPYADSSALPTFYLSHLTRDYVTVALNGDGGDENFAGYHRYSVNLMTSRLRRLPNAAKKAGLLGIASMARTLGPRHVLNRRLRALEVALTGHQSYVHLMTTFDDDRKRELYTADFGRLVERSSAEQMFDELYAESDSANVIDEALDADVGLYLPEDLLVKVDIASMAVGLETRAPLLDHKFMEFVARLPARFKLDWALNRKAIFKKTLRNLLPKEILERRKMGFGVPLEHWFRGGMKDLLQDYLLSSRARERDYFNSRYVERLIQDHVDGSRNCQHLLWNLLMLELWHRLFIDSKVQPETVLPSERIAPVDDAALSSARLNGGPRLDG